MQHQPSGHASEAAGLPEGQSGVWPPADLQPAPPAQQPMLQQQGSGGTGQSPVQPHLAGSWQWQQPSDPRLRTRMQPAQQPAASQHPLQQCYPPQPTPQHTWQQPTQHAGQQLPAQHAGLPLHRPLAGASTPPHPAWGLPAAVDAHNVGRVLVGRDQLVDVVHLERELQRAGTGLSLLKGLLLRIKRGVYQLRQISGLDDDGKLSLQHDALRLLPAQASRTGSAEPHPDEIANLAQLWQERGQPRWTAGDVARLRWQRRLVEEWPKKIDRDPASGAALPLRPDLLFHLAAELQDLAPPLGFLQRGRVNLDPWAAQQGQHAQQPEIPAPPQPLAPPQQQHHWHQQPGAALQPPAGLPEQQAAVAAQQQAQQAQQAHAALASGQPPLAPSLSGLSVVLSEMSAAGVPASAAAAGSDGVSPFSPGPTPAAGAAAAPAAPVPATPSAAAPSQGRDALPPGGAAGAEHRGSQLSMPSSRRKHATQAPQAAAAAAAQQPAPAHVPLAGAQPPPRQLYLLQDSDEEEAGPAAAQPPAASALPDVLQDSDAEDAHTFAEPPPAAQASVSAGRGSPLPPLPPLPAEPQPASATDTPTAARAGSAATPKVAVIPKNRPMVVIPPKLRDGMQAPGQAAAGGDAAAEASPVGSPAGKVGPAAAPGAHAAVPLGLDATAAAAAAAAHAHSNATAAAAAAAEASPYDQPYAYYGYFSDGYTHTSQHAGYLAWQAYSPYQAAYAFPAPAWQTAASGYAAWHAGSPLAQAYASPAAAAQETSPMAEQQAGEAAGGGAAEASKAGAGRREGAATAAMLQEMAEELQLRRSGERPGLDDPEADPACWDPGWALESRLVGMLSRHGGQPFPVLLERLGSTPLPAFLAAEPGEGRAAMLKRLIENRPQLFDVFNGDTIQLEKGARGFLRLKQRILQALYCCPNKRAPVSEMHAVAVQFLDDNVLDLTVAIHSTVRKAFSAFLRTDLGDWVWSWRQGTKGTLIAELRPFEADRPSIAPDAASFPAQCATQCFMSSGCMMDVSCPKSHAAPRSEAVDPADSTAVSRLCKQRALERPASEGTPSAEQPQAGSAAAEGAGEQQPQAFAAGAALAELAAATADQAGAVPARSQRSTPGVRPAPSGGPSETATVDAAEVHGAADDTAASRVLWAGGPPGALSGVQREQAQPEEPAASAPAAAAAATAPAAATPTRASGAASPAPAGPPSCTCWRGVVRFEEAAGDGGGCVPMSGSWWRPDGGRAWHNLLQPGESLHLRGEEEVEDAVRLRAAVAQWARLAAPLCLLRRDAGGGAGGEPHNEASSLLCEARLEAALTMLASKRSGYLVATPAPVLLGAPLRVVQQLLGEQGLPRLAVPAVEEAARAAGEDGVLLALALCAAPAEPPAGTPAPTAAGQQPQQEQGPSCSLQPGSREPTPDCCELAEGPWQARGDGRLPGAAGRFAPLQPLQRPPLQQSARGGLAPGPDGLQGGQPSTTGGGAAATRAAAAGRTAAPRRGRSRSRSASTSHGRGKRRRRSRSSRRTRSGSSRRVRSRSRGTRGSGSGERGAPWSIRRSRGRGCSRSRGRDRSRSRPAPVDLADDFWDPTWRLELACVRALAQLGSTPPSALFRLVVVQGGVALPPCLFAGRHEDEEIAFKSFLGERMHLFKPELARGSALRVCLLPGAEAFLHYKRAVLACLWDAPSNRCRSSDLAAHLRVEAGMDRRMREQAADLRGFALAYLRDAVYIRKGWLELRPFRSRDVSFPPQCKFAAGDIANCRHGVLCRYCHAPPRGHGPMKGLVTARLSAGW